MAIDYFKEYPRGTRVIYNFAVLDDVYGLSYLAFSSLGRVGDAKLKKLMLDLHEQIGMHGSAGIDRWIGQMQRNGFKGVPSVICAANGLEGDPVACERAVNIDRARKLLAEKLKVMVLRCVPPRRPRHSTVER
jgi:hypothetical protein